jgi:hypothetical protein
VEENIQHILCVGLANLETDFSKAGLVIFYSRIQYIFSSLVGDAAPSKGV